jgi:ribA/ribD-fused uncharacterized protein
MLAVVPVGREGESFMDCPPVAGQRLIPSFTGQYRFLSNFWPVSIAFDGETYSSVEHAYQAAKTLDLVMRAWVRDQGTPAAARRLGGTLDLRPGWAAVRIEIMRDLLRRKFKDFRLREALLATGDSFLVEGNAWDDRFWGQSPIGRGQNHLGRLLMEVRAEIQGGDLQGTAMVVRASG